MCVQGEGSEVEVLTSRSPLRFSMMLLRILVSPAVKLTEVLSVLSSDMVCG